MTNFIMNRRLLMTSFDLAGKDAFQPNTMFSNNQLKF